MKRFEIEILPRLKLTRDGHGQWGVTASWFFWSLDWKQDR
jgi:hypothetical protein